jgi:uncharacterized protein (DUF1697 family)
MNTYIALLRGINVSGHKIIRMADLKKALEDTGFLNVKTYIQSGNIVFKTDSSPTADLEKRIEKMIRDVFTFEVTVIVKEHSDLVSILERNPYPEKDLKNNEKLFFTLLSHTPEKQKLETLMATNGGADELMIIDRTIYVICRAGYSETIYTTNFLEKILKVKATSRNIDTIKKLVEMGKDG